MRIFQNQKLPRIMAVRRLCIDVNKLMKTRQWKVGSYTSHLGTLSNWGIMFINYILMYLRLIKFLDY